MTQYDENYFENGVQLGISGYTAYRWLETLTMSMCRTLVSHLGLQKGAKVVDYGCAKGFLVRALRALEIDACGVDISAYAIKKADYTVRNHVFLMNEERASMKRLTIDRVNSTGRFDCAISKDVLEHVAYDKLHSVLSTLRELSDMLFIVVPLGENGKYVIPEYEADVTHVIRENKSWWEQQVVAAGWNVTNSVTRVPGIKDNWAHYSDGNLFLVAK